MSVKIYTDGSCIGNPGPGGWAALIKGPQQTYKIQDGHPQTTNNRMELTAVIWGIKTALAKFPEQTHLEVYSDSSWVVKTMTDNWKRKKNLDLWDELTPLLTEKQISWHWVRGHAGHPENEDCDTRAQNEAKKQLKHAKQNPSQKKFVISPQDQFDFLDS
ncbi:ribonuclease HI [Patescibacteria group bacterium]|nr:ribonuclease HI [Patescibacteria group bacterium]